ncbi:MAG: TIGR02646 family protein [Blastocatellia bacterium]|nr:TIGR02646 family protein [Blastocatellia bacterium]
MMRLQRPDAPLWLSENWEAWGKEYQQKRQEKPRYQFKWKIYKKVAVNHLLIPLLREMTADHCSFCDASPMISRLKETIEHFQPKSLYPLLVYQWANLFLCCYKCQGAKGEQFKHTLLKPDEMDYQFHLHFVVNFETGELSANPDNSPENQQRVKDTIALYNLNDPERLNDRICEFRKYTKISDPNVADFSYRFMFL